MSTLMNLNTSNQNIDVSNGPALQKPTGFIDVTVAAFDDATKNAETFSKANLINDIKDEQDEVFLNSTGLNLSNEISKYKEIKNPILNKTSINEVLIDNDNARDLYIEGLRESDPDKAKGLMTSIEVLEEARIRANESKANFNLVAENANSTARMLGSFVGNMGSAATDPVNIATLPFGVVKGASVLKAFATEAVIGMGSEALIQPKVQAWHAERGLEYNGVVSNVLTAGVVGGVLGGVLQKASNVITDSKFLAIAEETKGLTAEQKMSINTLSKNASVNEKNPFDKTDNQGGINHYKSVDDMSKGYVNGENFPEIEMTITNREFNLTNDGFKLDPSLAKTARQLELDKFQNKVFYDIGDLEISTKKLEFSENSSKEFIRFIKNTNAKQATLVPIANKVAKTRSQVEKKIKELAEEERVRFPNVNKKLQKTNMIANKNQDGTFDIYRADNEIRLKKDESGKINKFTNRREANKDLQSGEYVVQIRKDNKTPKSEYVIVQGDNTGSAITTTNIGNAKFYDELYVPDLKVRMEESLANDIDVDDVPTRLDPVDEIMPLDDFELALKEGEELTKLDVITKQLDDIVDTDPNFKLLLDDGTEITVKALQKSIKEDEALIKQMKVCAI